MGVFYVDGTIGSNANNGTTRALAKADIAGVRAVLTTNWDVIYVRPGVYNSAQLFFSSVNDINAMYKTDTFYPGVAVIDFNEAAVTNYYWGFSNTVETCFVGMHFRNAAAGKPMLSWTTSVNSVPIVINCVFYSQNASPTGYGVGQLNSGGTLEVRDSSFYNLEKGTFINKKTTNCYFNTVTTPVFSGLLDHNAYPGNTETNGINTTGADPGFRDIANVDFRLDPTTTAFYDPLMTGGSNGGRIGSMGGPGIIYDASLPPLYFFVPDPLPIAGNLNPVWENEGPLGTNTYTTGIVGDIITVSNIPKIDLSTYPTAESGRMRSPVFDLGTSGNIDISSFVYGAIEGITAGAAIDINNTLPQQFEYRSAAASFLIGDNEVVGPVWTAIDNTSKLALNHRYMQVRITFRTDHTNSV